MVNGQACDLSPYLSPCSDWGIKIFDVLEEKEVKSDAVPVDLGYDGRPLTIEWSPDGQILTMTTRIGAHTARVGTCGCRREDW